MGLAIPQVNGHKPVNKQGVDNIQRVQERSLTMSQNIAGLLPAPQIAGLLPAPASEVQIKASDFEETHIEFFRCGFALGETDKGEMYALVHSSDSGKLSLDNFSKGMQEKLLTAIRSCSFVITCYPKQVRAYDPLIKAVGDWDTPTNAKGVYDDALKSKYTGVFVVKKHAILA